MIRIRHEEVHMLDSPVEPLIGTENQSELTISTGVSQAPQARNLPTMEKFIRITTAYNTGAKRNLRRISSTIIGGSTPVASETKGVDGVIRISDVRPSPTPCNPPYLLWDRRILNIRQTTTPNLRDTK